MKKIIFKQCSICNMEEYEYNQLKPYNLGNKTILVCKDCLSIEILEHLIDNAVSHINIMLASELLNDLKRELKKRIKMVRR